MSLSAHTEQQSDGEGAWEAPVTLDSLPTEQPAYSNTCTLPQNRDGIKGRETFTKLNSLGILLFTLPQNNLPSLCICRSLPSLTRTPDQGQLSFFVGCGIAVGFRAAWTVADQPQSQFSAHADGPPGSITVRGPWFNPCRGFLQSHVADSHQNVLCLSPRCLTMTPARLFEQTAMGGLDKSMDTQHASRIRLGHRNSLPC